MVSALASWLIALGGAAAPGEAILDSRRIDYVEDEGGSRAVAEVRAALVRRGGRTTLRVTASAVGPFVDPPAGFEGVRGANRITAREIESLVREGTIRAATRVGGEEAEVPFAFREGRRARLPERRRRPDRSIAPPRPRGELVPVELVAESAPLGEGDHETEILVRGMPRLLVRYTVEGGTGRVLALRGGHPRAAP